MEVLSAGYEKKDLEIGVPFYLKYGVKDVMVLDPFADRVTHYRRTSTTTHASPKTIALECGCVCTV